MAFFSFANFIPPFADVHTRQVYTGVIRSWVNPVPDVTIAALESSTLGRLSVYLNHSSFFTRTFTVSSSTTTLMSIPSWW